jgi:hypothetical protein
VRRNYDSCLGSTRLEQPLPVRETRVPCELPAYLLSVTARDVHVRRERWQRESQTGRVRADPLPWQPPAPSSAAFGLLVAVDSRGRIECARPCPTPQGVCSYRDGWLVAEYNRLRYWTQSLAPTAFVSTSALFNDIHSVRRDLEHVLVTSTGIDAIIELAMPDLATSWQWHAPDHGFDRDTFGFTRRIGHLEDHRAIYYDTWIRTTHVNSAIALDGERILATLFHQQMLVTIGKSSGLVTPVLKELRRPHALRHCRGAITVADTGRGRALLGHVVADRFEVAEVVELPGCAWLQDCQLVDDDTWLMVDGAEARVVFTDRDGRVLAIDRFDSSWYLYEAALGATGPVTEGDALPSFAEVPDGEPEPDSTSRRVS